MYKNGKAERFIVESSDGMYLAYNHSGDYYWLPVIERAKIFIDKTAAEIAVGKVEQKKYELKQVWVTL
jgi:hypothetical protein